MQSSYFHSLFKTKTNTPSASNAKIKSELKADQDNILKFKEGKMPEGYTKDNQFVVSKKSGVTGRYSIMDKNGKNVTHISGWNPKNFTIMEKREPFKNGNYVKLRNSSLSQHKYNKILSNNKFKVVGRRNGKLLLNYKGDVSEMNPLNFEKIKNDVTHIKKLGNSTDETAENRNSSSHLNSIKRSDNSNRQRVKIHKEKNVRNNNNGAQFEPRNLVKKSNMIANIIATNRFLERDDLKNGNIAKLKLERYFNNKYTMTKKRALHNIISNILLTPAHITLT